MIWLMRAIVRVYPAAWRKRYGSEFEALLEESGSGWFAAADLLKGAIQMQFTTWSFGKLALVLCFGGAVAGGLISAMNPRTYISEAELRLTPSGDSERIMQMQRAVMSRSGLAGVIRDPRLDLYSSERMHKPLEDVVETMRRNIRIRANSAPGSPVGAFNLAFSCPDPAKARLTVQRLITRFMEANASATTPGVQLRVLDPPNLPATPVKPNLYLFAAFGLCVGLALALGIKLFLKRRISPTLQA